MDHLYSQAVEAAVVEEVHLAFNLLRELDSWRKNYGWEGFNFLICFMRKIVICLHLKAHNVEFLYILKLY